MFAALCLGSVVSCSIFSTLVKKVATELYGSKNLGVKKNISLNSVGRPVKFWVAHFAQITPISTLVANLDRNV